MEELARVALLYLKGGIHLDFDVISIREFPTVNSLGRPMKNTVMMQLNERMNSAVMRFSKGNKFLEAVLEEAVSLMNLIQRSVLRILRIIPRSQVGSTGRNGPTSDPSSSRRQR